MAGRVNFFPFFPPPATNPPPSPRNSPPHNVPYPPHLAPPHLTPAPPKTPPPPPRQPFHPPPQSAPPPQPHPFFPPPPSPHVLPSPPPHQPFHPPPPPANPPNTGPPPQPPHPFLPPPPPHIIPSPPPPHIIPSPPPPHIIPSPPPPPGHHSTVIIIVFVSLGGLFLLGFILAGLFCIMKKRKKTIETAEITKFDDHVKIQEAIVPGPNGESAAIVMLEEDIHIEEKMHETEKQGEGVHPESAGSHAHANDAVALPSSGSNHLFLNHNT